MLDSLIIGAGPAGLTSAIYLQRSHRRVLVVGAGRSRARLIPWSRNVPGHAGGIRGRAWLDDLHGQARAFGIGRRMDQVMALVAGEDRFHAIGAHGEWDARAMILATGVVDRLPDLHGMRRAIAAGIVRLCAECDTYEAPGRRIAIHAEDGETALSHARFLRTCSQDVCALVATHRSCQIECASHGPIARFPRSACDWLCGSDLPFRPMSAPYSAMRSRRIFWGCAA